MNPPQPSGSTAPSLLITSRHIPVHKAQDAVQISEETTVFFHFIALNLTQLMCAHATEANDILEHPEKYPNFTEGFRSLCGHICAAEPHFSELFTLARRIPREDLDLEVALLESMVPTKVSDFCAFLVEASICSFVRFQEGFLGVSPDIELTIRVLLKKMLLPYVHTTQDSMSASWQPLLQECTERIKRAPKTQRSQAQARYQQFTSNVRDGLELAPPVIITPITPPALEREHEQYLELLTLCILETDLIKELQESITGETEPTTVLDLTTPLMQVVNKYAEAVLQRPDADIKAWLKEVQEKVLEAPPTLGDFCSFLVETSIYTFRKYQDKKRQTSEKKLRILRGALTHLFMPYAKVYEQKSQAMQKTLVETTDSISKLFRPQELRETYTLDPSSSQLPPEVYDFFHEITISMLDETAASKLLELIDVSHENPVEIAKAMGSAIGSNWHYPPQFLALCRSIANARGIVELVREHAKNPSAKNPRSHTLVLPPTEVKDTPVRHYRAALVEMTLLIFNNLFESSIPLINKETMDLYREVLDEIYRPITEKYSEECTKDQENYAKLTEMLRPITLMKFLLNQLLFLNTDELGILEQILENEKDQPTIRLGKWEHFLAFAPRSAVSLQAVFQSLADPELKDFDLLLGFLVREVRRISASK